MRVSVLLLAFFLAAASATRPGICTNFAKIWNAYPSDATLSRQILKTLGGDMSWMRNTCAIRMTMAFRALGVEPGELLNAQWKDGKKRKYLVRVNEYKRFLTTAFGPPAWTSGPGKASGKFDAAGKMIYDYPEAIQGKAGIVRYSECKFTDATGHIDVWDGYRNRGHGYPQKCKKIEVWNVCNPVQEPDFSPIYAYMKSSKAWDMRTQPTKLGPAPISVKDVAGEQPTRDYRRPVQKGSNGDRLGDLVAVRQQTPVVKQSSGVSLADLAGGEVPTNRYQRPTLPGSNAAREDRLNLEPLQLKPKPIAPLVPTTVKVPTLKLNPQVYNPLTRQQVQPVAPLPIKPVAPLPVKPVAPIKLNPVAPTRGNRVTPFRLQPLRSIPTLNPKPISLQPKQPSSLDLMRLAQVEQATLRYKRSTIGGTNVGRPGMGGRA